MLSPASIDRDSSYGSEHYAFLQRAAHDSQFRAALEENPRAALAEFGLHLDPEQIPSQVTLPNAANILDVLIDVEDPDTDRSGPPDRFMWYGFLGT